MLCIALTTTSEIMLLNCYLVEPSVNEAITAIYAVILSGVGANPLSRIVKQELNNLNSVLQTLRLYVLSKGAEHGIVEVTLGRQLNSPVSSLVAYGLNSATIKSQVLEARSMRFTMFPTENMVNAEKVLMNVVSHGETRKTDLEESKRLVLQMESDNQRCAKNALKKNWKRISTFNGAFAPVDFYEFCQVNTAINDGSSLQHLQNPYFTYRIAKMTIKSRARPFLKLSLLTKNTETSSQIKKPIQFGNTVNPILSDLYAQPAPQNFSNIEIGAQQIYKAANQIYNMGRLWGNHVKNTIKTILPKPSQLLPNIKEAQQLSVTQPPNVKLILIQ